jgi:hypothetical protein
MADMAVQSFNIRPCWENILLWINWTICKLQTCLYPITVWPGEPLSLLECLLDCPLENAQKLQDSLQQSSNIFLFVRNWLMEKRFKK